MARFKLHLNGIKMQSIIKQILITLKPETLNKN